MSSKGDFWQDIFADGASGQQDALTEPTSNDYKSLNEQIWGEGGGGWEAYLRQLEREKETQPELLTAHTDEEMREKLEAAQIDPAWLEQWDQPRTKQAGQSGADEHFLSDGSYAYIQFCKRKYADATDAEEKAYWHREAEKTRARVGYYGGQDGSMYITEAQLTEDAAADGLAGYPADGTPGYAADTPQGRMQALLDAWQSAALEQSNASIDYAVQQAIREYERALQDTQPQFKETAESVSLEERQAMDNAALYAQMRGDRGGIGREQYSSIQNTAAQNRLAVQQAQTKLATDTAREIEDLRAKGEFEKADAALEITQEYLSRLMSLEQWAAEYNFSQEQFAAQMEQWRAEYALDMQQLQNSQDRWETEFTYEQYLDSLQQQQTTETESAGVDLEEIYRELYEFGMTDEDRASIKTYLINQGIGKELADAIAAAYVNNEYLRLRFGMLDRWGDGWSETKWSQIMLAAEDNLKKKKYSAFSEYNMAWITSLISREQWIELRRLMERYGYDPFGENTP